jgi:hypothetical protein
MEPYAAENWQTNCAPLPPRGEGEENHPCLYDTLSAPPPLGKLNAPTRFRRGRIQFANRRRETKLHLVSDKLDPVPAM